MLKALNGLLCAEVPLRNCPLTVLSRLVSIHAFRVQPNLEKLQGVSLVKQKSTVVIAVVVVAAAAAVYFAYFSQEKFVCTFECCHL